MPWYLGKYITFAEHPLHDQICKLWDKWLVKFDYPKDINVCSLPKHHLEFIYTEIDREVEHWFKAQLDYDTMDGLKQCWNYQARHLRNFK